MMAAAAAHCSLFATRSLLSNTVRTVIQSLTLTLLLNWLRLDRFSWSKEQRRKGSEKRYRSQKVKRLVKRDQRSGRRPLFFAIHKVGLVAVIILSPHSEAPTSSPPVLDLLSSRIGLLPFQTTDWYVNRCCSSCVLRYATLRLRLPATLLNSAALGLLWIFFALGMDRFPVVRGSIAGSSLPVVHSGTQQ